MRGVSCGLKTDNVGEVLGGGGQSGRGVTVVGTWRLGKECPCSRPASGGGEADVARGASVVQGECQPVSDMDRSPEAADQLYVSCTVFRIGNFLWKILDLGFA